MPIYCPTLPYNDSNTMIDIIRPFQIISKDYQIITVFMNPRLSNAHENIAFLITFYRLNGFRAITIVYILQGNSKDGYWNIYESETTIAANKTKYRPYMHLHSNSYPIDHLWLGLFDILCT